MSDITVEAVVSLKLKLPPESAAIISEIVVGDRVFTPSGEHQYEIPTHVVAEAVDQLEKEKVETKTEPQSEEKAAGKAMKICEYKPCSKRFMPKNKRSRFCSSRCGNAVYQENYFARQKARSKPAAAGQKKKPAFGAAGAKSDTPVGTRPLNVGDPAAPRSYARQGD